MTSEGSHPASHFEQLYAARVDPYRFAEKWYEQRKYALTLASMTRPRYRHALEIGCAEGMFTQQLSTRCDHVTAVDASPTATARARDRLRLRCPTVQVDTLVVPGDWPADEDVDLIVVSEVGYYLGAADLSGMCSRLGAASAEVVAVHWRHRSPDLPTDGEEVHARLEAVLSARDRRVHHVERDFLLDVWDAP